MGSDLERVNGAAAEIDLRREPSDGGHRFVLTARGELDLDTAPSLQEALFDAASYRDASVHVDLGDLDFMDSSGVHALLDGRAAVERSGGSLRLVAMSPAVGAGARRVGSHGDARRRRRFVDLNPHAIARPDALLRYRSTPIKSRTSSTTRTVPTPMYI